MIASLVPSLSLSTSTNTHNLVQDVPSNTRPLSRGSTHLFRRRILVRGHPDIASVEGASATGARTKRQTAQEPVPAAVVPTQRRRGSPGKAAPMGCQRAGRQPRCGSQGAPDQVASEGRQGRQGGWSHVLLGDHQGEVEGRREPWQGVGKVCLERQTDYTNRIWRTHSWRTQVLLGLGALVKACCVYTRTRQAQLQRTTQIDSKNVL